MSVTRLDQPMEIQKNDGHVPNAIYNSSAISQGTKAPISYKDSLIGYNGCYGINNGRETKSKQ